MTRLLRQHKNLNSAQLATYLAVRDDWAIKETRTAAPTPSASATTTSASITSSPITSAGGHEHGHGHSHGSQQQRRFTLEHGPFRRWEREVRWQPAQTDPTLFDIEERIEYELISPLLAALIKPVLKRSLPTEISVNKTPFWAPPGRFDQHQFRVFSLLILATLLAAFLGTLLSQTMTYVADEFSEGTATQGNVIALTRIGALIALIFVQIADRKGRKRVLLAAGAIACTFSVVSGLTTSIWFFAIAQTVARGASTAFSLLIGIVASEECPRRSRAWMVSVLTLFAGLGSGMVVWFLPLIALHMRAWRGLYVAAILGFAIIYALTKKLSETRRFETYAESATPAPISAQMLRRFALLAIVAFATAAFSAPASNFLNEYLKTERHFSAADITKFAIATNTPIGLGVAFFGPLADRQGRKKLAIMGIWAGAIFTAARFSFTGAPMWIAALAATILGSAVIPALGVYGPELFPTSRRTLANALLTMVGVTGSAIGLIAAGRFIETHGYSATFSVLAIVPLIASIAVLAYPETAGRSLEELNPEDKYER